MSDLIVDLLASFVTWLMVVAVAVLLTMLIFGLSALVEGAQ